MTRYHVHYQVSTRKGWGERTFAHMIAPIEAKSEKDAIAQCKATRPGSFGHWVNRLANEVVQ